MARIEIYEALSPQAPICGYGNLTPLPKSGALRPSKVSEAHRAEHDISSQNFCNPTSLWYEQKCIEAHLFYVGACICGHMCQGKVGAYLCACMYTAICMHGYIRAYVTATAPRRETRRVLTPQAKPLSSGRRNIRRQNPRKQRGVERRLSKAQELENSYLKPCTFNDKSELIYHNLLSNRIPTLYSYRTHMVGLQRAKHNLVKAP